MSQLGSNKNSVWKVYYHEPVVKIDIPALGRTESSRIKKAIENKLFIDPVLYGVPLRATLKRYWKLRVGDYRVVYSIKGHEVTIFAIGHRRNVYDIAGKRA